MAPKLAAFLSRPRLAPLVVLALWSVGASAMAVDPEVLLVVGAIGLAAWSAEGWYILATHPDPPIQTPRRAALTIALLAAVVTTPFTHWPLRVAFLVARPALADLADRSGAGIPRAREWAGPFWIVTVRESEGAMCLWTKFDGYSASGFVRRGEEGSHPDLDACTVVRLDDRWSAVFVTNCAR